MVPTLPPFNFHWYDGVVPPLVGVAVKVTLVPEQILLSASLDAIETAGVTGKIQDPSSWVADGL